MSDYKFPRSMNVEEVEEALKKLTIFDYIEYSGYSKEDIKSMLNQKDQKAMKRDSNILPNMSDSAVGFYWFKNHLHTHLKKMVQDSPSDKRGCSRKVIEMDMRRDMLSFYEHGQQNFRYTREDVESWIEKT